MCWPLNCQTDELWLLNITWISSSWLRCLILLRNSIIRFIKNINTLFTVFVGPSKPVNNTHTHTQTHTHTNTHTHTHTHIYIYIYIYIYTNTKLSAKLKSTKQTSLSLFQNSPQRNTKRKFHDFLMWDLCV